MESTKPLRANRALEAAQRGNYNASFQQLRVTLQSLSYPTTVKTFVWSGNTIAEERNASGSTTTKRFFAEGEQRVGGVDAGNYYYTRDHLGSVREVTDSGGNLVTQLDYDAWGNEVVVSGSMNVDFGYTGHYFHQTSGLNLAMYRAYNPTLARWISRDPLEERGGLNLYRYASDNPVVKTDPFGLFPLYGNYCGPGNKPAPPINCVDTACQHHDDCYAKCGVAGFSGAFIGNACSRKCDQNLCKELTACKPKCFGERAARNVIDAIFCGAPTSTDVIYISFD